MSCICSEAAVSLELDDGDASLHDVTGTMIRKQLIAITLLTDLSFLQREIASDEIDEAERVELRTTHR